VEGDDGGDASGDPTAQVPHRPHQLVPFDVTDGVQTTYKLSTQRTGELPDIWICMWSWPCGCEQREGPGTKEGCLAVMLQIRCRQRK